MKNLNNFKLFLILSKRALTLTIIITLFTAHFQVCGVAFALITLVNLIKAAVLKDLQAAEQPGRHDKAVALHD